MADVDFASQVLNAANQRINTRFNDQVNRSNELRKTQTDALMAKIGETDPYGNPVLDAEGVSNALDAIQKLHNNNPATKDIIGKAKDALGKIHGLIKAPPAVRREIHGRVMGIAQDLHSKGEIDVHDPTAEVPGVQAPEETEGSTGGMPPPPASTPAPTSASTPAPTSTPTQEPTRTIAPPPWTTRAADQSGAPSGAPQAAQPTYAIPPPPAVQAPQAAAQAAPAPMFTQPTPAPVGHTGNAVADVLAAGRAKLNPLALYEAEQSIAHKNLMEQQGKQQDSAERIAKTAAGSRETVAETGAAAKTGVAGTAAGARVEAARIMANGKPERAVEAGNMTADQARHNISQGVDMLDEKGEPFDPDTVAPDMEVKEFSKGPFHYYRAGRKTFNSATKPLQKFKQNANGTYTSVLVDPVSNQDIPGTENSNIVPPAALLPLLRTREQITVDPETGQPTVTKLESTSQRGAPAPVSTPSATPAPAATPKPAVAPTAVTSAAATPTPAPQPTRQGTGRKIGMPVGLYNSNVGREIPLREAYTQILGSPDHPDLGSLKDFAKIADDKERSARLNAAVQATFNPIDLGEKTHGGIINYIQLVGGLPTAINQAQSGANAKLISDNLGNDPELHDAYNSLMTAYSNIVALRSFTGASAAQFSVRQLENELPIPGGNSFSSRDFYDKMAKLAKNMENAAVKTTTMPPSERKYITDQVNELTRLSKGSAIPPPPASRNNAGSRASGKIRVKGPNGQTGTADADAALPSGWSKVDK